MKVRFSKKFKKQYKKLPRKIREVFGLRLDIFMEDKNSLLLRNHILVGKLRGIHSINITGDVRALYVERKNNEIIFVAIGTHSELYK